MSFSDAEEENLINQVAQNPSLYDASHTNYVNSIIKDKIWQNIGEVLKKSDEDCKKKWKSIRDSYQRYKKNSKMGTGSAAIKKSKQNRHLQLAFLDSVPHHRVGSTNITPSDQEHNVNNENVSVDEQEQVSDTTFSNHNEEQSNSDQTDEIGSEATKNMPNVEKATAPKKKKKEDPLLTIWKQRDEQRQSLYKNIAKRMDDDIDLFCRHIGEVLRSLPPYEKAKAKKHLGEVISDYEIMAASHSSERSTLSSSTSNNRASTPTFSDMYTPSSSLSQQYIRPVSPLGSKASPLLSRPASSQPLSPVFTRRGNAPGYFQLGACSSFSTARASPGPSGTTRGQGYLKGPAHNKSCANPPMSTDVVSQELVNRIDREEEESVGTVLGFL